MADSLAEQLRKRREAMEEGDATGGDSFDEERPDKGDIRKEVEKEISKRRREAQSTDSNQ